MPHTENFSIQTRSKNKEMSESANKTEFVSDLKNVLNVQQVE